MGARQQLSEKCGETRVTETDNHRESFKTNHTQHHYHHQPTRFARGVTTLRHKNDHPLALVLHVIYPPTTAFVLSHYFIVFLRSDTTSRPNLHPSKRSSLFVVTAVCACVLRTVVYKTYLYFNKKGDDVTTTTGSYRKPQLIP